MATETARRGGITSVYHFMIEQTGWYGKCALLLAVATGLAQTAAVGILAQSIEVLLDNQSPLPSPWLFLSAILGLAVLMFAANRHATGVGQRIAGDVGLKITEGASHVGLRELDRIGPERILRAATAETAAIARNVQTALDLLTSAVCILSIIALFVIYDGIVGLSVVVTFLVVVPLLVRNAARVRIAEARAVRVERRFTDLATHAIKGFRELRINERKHAALYDQYLTRSIERAGEANTAWSSARSRHIRYIVITWLIGLAIAGFAVPQLKSVEGLGAIAFLYTYMIRMLAVVAFSSISLIDGAAPIERVRQLLGELDNQASEPIDGGRARTTFQTLEAKGITFVHRDPDGEEIFKIGPLDFSIQAGEVVFITGANGSGKTTLIRTLTGLYPHAEGEILLNGRQASAGDLRQLYATVFTDYCLLNPLYGLTETDTERAEELIASFGLGHKVRFNGHRFSTTDLSSGQRRRLALIAALLEERPLLLLDEWTADQDPSFRRRFFEEILPDCRARGQAVLAITHDDRYFGYCDRRFHLNMGELSLAA